MTTDGRAITQANQVTTKTYVDTSITNAINGSSASSNAAFVKKVGDIMTGILNMSGQRIANVGNPATGTDAANVNWTRSVFYGNSASGATNNIFISSAGPSGGNAGDVWLQY